MTTIENSLIVTPALSAVALARHVLAVRHRLASEAVCAPVVAHPEFARLCDHAAAVSTDSLPDYWETTLDRRLIAAGHAPLSDIERAILAKATRCPAASMRILRNLGSTHGITVDDAIASLCGAAIAA